MYSSVNFLGQKLAKLINKGTLPSIGLIRLAIRDEFPIEPYPSYEQLKKVIQNSLQSRLKRIGIADELLPFIQKEMLSHIKINQSIIILGKV